MIYLNGGHHPPSTVTHVASISGAPKAEVTSKGKTVLSQTLSNAAIMSTVPCPAAAACPNGQVCADRHGIT